MWLNGRAAVMRDGPVPLQGWDKQSAESTIRVREPARHTQVFTVIDRFVSSYMDADFLSFLPPWRIICYHSIYVFYYSFSVANLKFSCRQNVSILVIKQYFYSI